MQEAIWSWRYGWSQAVFDRTGSAVGSGCYFSWILRYGYVASFCWRLKAGFTIGIPLYTHFPGCCIMNCLEGFKSRWRKASWKRMLSCPGRDDSKVSRQWAGHGRCWVVWIWTLLESGEMFSWFPHHLLSSAACTSNFKLQAAFGLMIYTPPTSQDLLERAIRAHQKAHQLLTPWTLCVCWAMWCVVAHPLGLPRPS